MSVTLSTIRTRAKQRADMEKSKFVTDAEWNAFINAAYKELYDLLVLKFEDYFITENYSNTIASGSDSFALPSNFYKVVGIDVLRSGTAGTTSASWEKLERFNFNERNRDSDEAVRNRLRFPIVRYRLLGSNVKIAPASRAEGTYRLWYVPKATELSADGDTLDEVNGYEEYVILDSAMKAATKEENYELVQTLSAQKQLQTERIEQAAANRDIGDADTITDVYAKDWFY